MAATYAHNKALGDFGERLAVQELSRLGFVVLDRNWRCRMGEIDIVARDGVTLVICEVKARRSDRYGSPVQAITAAKAARLHRLAQQWCAEHDHRFGRVRIDVVAVLVAPRSAPVVTHFPGLA